MPKMRVGEAAAGLVAVASLVFIACSPTTPTITTGPGSTTQPESTATRSSTIPTATALTAGTTAAGTPTSTPQNPLAGAATSTVTVIFGGPFNGIALTITEPQDEAVVEDKVVTVRGRTSPGAIVSINGNPVSVDANGNFAQSVTLEEGPNHFAVTAADSDGDMATAEFTISYAP